MTLYRVRSVLMTLYRVRSVLNDTFCHLPPRCWQDPEGSALAGSAREPAYEPRRLSAADAEAVDKRVAGRIRFAPVGREGGSTGIRWLLLVLEDL